MDIKKIKQISKKLASEFELNRTYDSCKEKTNDFISKTKEKFEKVKDVINKESAQYDSNLIAEKLMLMQGKKIELVVNVVDDTYSIGIVDEIFENIDDNFLICPIELLSSKPELLFLSKLLYKNNCSFLDKFKEEFGKNIFDYVTFLTTIDFTSEEKIKELVDNICIKNQTFDDINIQDYFSNEPFEHIAEIMKTKLTKENVKRTIKDMTITYSTTIEIKDEYEQRIEEVVLLEVNEFTTDLFYSNMLELVLTGQVFSMDIVVIREKNEIGFFVTSSN